MPVPGAIAAASAAPAAAAIKAKVKEPRNFILAKLVGMIGRLVELDLQDEEKTQFLDGIEDNYMLRTPKTSSTMFQWPWGNC